MGHMFTGRDRDRVDVVIVEDEMQVSLEGPAASRGRVLRTLVSGVREWVTVIGGYQPYSSAADRARSRSMAAGGAQRHYEEVRLHWPDGVRVERQVRDGSARWN